MKLVFVLAFLFWSGNAYCQQLTVNISNIPGPEGKIIVELFQNEDDFLEKPYKRKVVSIKGTSAKVVFENLPAGEYAFGVIHDKNNNGELDTFMKIPREPVALSNNATPDFGPPSYTDSKFRVSSGQNVTQNIHFSD